MTKDTLKNGNSILYEIDYCEQALEHIALKHRLYLRFDTTKECIESSEELHCPAWLLSKIAEAIDEHRKNKQKEFEEL